MCFTKVGLLVALSGGRYDDIFRLDEIKCLSSNMSSIVCIAVSQKHSLRQCFTSQRSTYGMPSHAAATKNKQTDMEEPGGSGEAAAAHILATHPQTNHSAPLDEIL